MRQILENAGVEIPTALSSKAERREFVQIMLNWFNSAQKNKKNLVYRLTQDLTPLQKQVKMAETGVKVKVKKEISQLR